MYRKDFELVKGDRIAIYCNGKRSGIVVGAEFDPVEGWFIRFTDDTTPDSETHWRQGTLGGKVYRRSTQKERPGIDLTELINAMTSARKKGRKWPVVRTMMPGLPDLRFTLSGPNSKFPGTVNICSGDKLSWYGRIFTNGKVHLNSVVDPLIVAVLVLAQGNFEDFCRSYGCITGQCCFCGRTLTRHESIVAGYGPICAERYGLTPPYEFVSDDIEQAERAAD